MGFNATLVILNDRLHEIREDKERLSPADLKWCKVMKYDAQQELERR